MLRRTDGGIRISFTAGLLWGWFTLINGVELTGLILLAAILHEMGHLLVLRLAGAKVRRLDIGVSGAIMDADTSRLTYGEELAAVLAGPMMNILAAGVCGIWGGSSLFIGANVVLCVFNLMPVRPLDGGRALYLLAVWIWDIERGERLAGTVGGITAMALALVLSEVMYRSRGSLWLLPPAVWMMTVSVREFWNNDEKFLVFL